MRHLNNILFYNWKNLDIAVIMGADFEATGIDIDVSGECGTDNLARSDFIIMVISDDLLKSPQDMHEILSIYSNNTLKDKIIPIITADARIFDDVGMDSYVSYWENEADKLKKQADSRDSIIDMDDISVYADDYIRIADNITSCIGYIIDKGCFAWPAVRKTNYSVMLEYMGYGKDEIDRTIAGIEERKKAQNKENQLSGYDKVRNMLERSVVVNPDDNESWHNLADLLEEQYGEYDKAKECYLKALSLHPDDIDAHYDLAIMLRTRLDDYAGAAQHYEEIIKLNPRYIAAHYELALLLKDKLHNIQKGMKHYRIACELDPDLRLSALDEAFGV